MSVHCVAMLTRASAATREPSSGALRATRVHQQVSAPYKGTFVMKQFILIVALLISAARADASEYTDVYFNPAESGWGVFLVQSDTTQFLAFFIYGTDNKPTWYTAQLAQDVAGNYDGPLYATTGTYFGLPWNPAQWTVDAVGTVSFVPIDIYSATVTYALTGGPTVTKTVQRQTLRRLSLPENTGSISGTAGASNLPTMMTMSAADLASPSRRPRTRRSSRSPSPTPRIAASSSR